MSCSLNFFLFAIHSHGHRSVFTGLTDLLDADGLLTKLYGNLNFGKSSGKYKCLPRGFKLLGKFSKSRKTIAYLCSFSHLGSSSLIFLSTNRSLPHGKYSDGYRPVALGVGQQRAQEFPKLNAICKVICNISRLITFQVLRRK